MAKLSCHLQCSWSIFFALAVLLSHYIASLRGKRLVENRTVVELGAGCGLPGLVAARFAQQVLLTDGNEIVMDLLDRNTRNVVNARSMRLEWGTAVSLPNDLDLDAVDVVIAADVVQWPAEVEPLLQTVKALLGTSRCDRPTFALGIVNRAQNTYNQFFGLAQEMGFAWEKVPEQTFLPDGQVPACCQEFGGRVTEIFEVYLVDRPPALQNLPPPPPPPQDLVVGQQQQQKQQQQQDSS